MKNTLMAAILLLVSCQSEEVSKPPVIKNKYPIEYIGKKYFEYNKPYFSQFDSITKSGDTVAFYSIANKSSDTIWVETVPNDDRIWLKDSSIKIICKSRISEHRIDIKDWIGFSDDNRSWGHCNDSVKLYPNEVTYFCEG